MIKILKLNFRNVSIQWKSLVILLVSSRQSWNFKIIYVEPVEPRTQWSTNSKLSNRISVLNEPKPLNVFKGPTTRWSCLKSSISVRNNIRWWKQENHLPKHTKCEYWCSSVLRKLIFTSFAILSYIIKKCTPLFSYLDYPY